MPENEAAPQRDALYYPYIQIRDENWLKATLLCFGRVCRITPDNFATGDYAITERYASLTVRDRPLLDRANIYDQPVLDAKRALKQKIKENLDELKKRFDKDHTPPEYWDGEKSFQIHRDKLLGIYGDDSLAKLLIKHHLAWPTTRTDDEWKDTWFRDQWLTMHPRLGSAVMTIIALAVEKNEGLHIVTPSVRAHNVLLADREDQVFQALLEIPTAHSEADLGETVDEIAHLVITTGFDLTRLEPEDIQKIIADGADLQEFRASLTTFANTIPAGMGPRARKRRLEEQADAVLVKWRERQKLLPRPLRQSFNEIAIERIAEKAGEKIVGGLRGGAAGAAAGVAVTNSLLGAFSGFAISLVIVSGVKAYIKHRDHPMRYLNRIQKATDRSFGALYVPQWTALAAAYE